jgi:hypothetical protein
MFVSMLLVALSACSEPEAQVGSGTPPAATGDKLIDGCGPVTATGYCGVKFGMTREEAAQAFPLPLESFGGGNAEPSECFMVFPEGRSKELTFMIVNGRVARVDIYAAGIEADDGSHVGSSESEILQSYGDRASVSPNKYDDAKHDIFVTTAPNSQFIFETDGTKVVNFRAGVLPAVAFVEGCG